MPKWYLLTEPSAGEVWNKNLAAFDDCSPFQTFEWGQYHKALGWEPVHYVFKDENEKVRALMLGLLRRFPCGTGFLWCAGGPVGDIKTWNENLRETILETAKLRRLYIRFRCDRERDVKDVLRLGHEGWTRSVYQMGSSFSLELDLDQNPERIRAAFSGKWRRNLRLAEKNDLVVKPCVNPDLAQLRRMFAEMEARKNLPELFSVEKLENLFRHNRENLIFYVCEDRSGNLLGCRAALLSGAKGCDYLAASGEAGRVRRVSYLLLWKIISECRARGVARYDLGGIDPWANPGVYTFKKETNAREVEFLGEWDWATSASLRLLGNWLIWQRQNPGKAKNLHPVNSVRRFAGAAIEPFKRSAPPVSELNYEPNSGGEIGN